MRATLPIADQRRAYTLSDRVTYLALKDKLDLAALAAGDSALHNIYHAYVVNPAKHPLVRSHEARVFTDFLTAPATQRVIGDFGAARYGQPLFVPAAAQDSMRPRRQR